jgi:GT2 family glycosyltransferase
VTRPKASVIVVSYNRAADLRLCLSAIFDSKLADLEVIVVDNASTDHAASVARSFSAVKLITNQENVGFAAANNLALEQARGEYVALVNNDAVIEDTWLPELVSFLDRTPRAAAAGGRLYHWNDDNPLGDKSNHFFGYGELQSDGSTPAVRDPAELQRETPFLSPNRRSMTFPSDRVDRVVRLASCSAVSA